MNGELPMIAPVSGLRSGAPGGSVSSAMNSDDAEQAEQGEPQAALLVGRQLAVALAARSRRGTRPGAARPSYR